MSSLFKEISLPLLDWAKIWKISEKKRGSEQKRDNSCDCKAGTIKFKYKSKADNKIVFYCNAKSKNVL